MPQVTPQTIKPLYDAIVVGSGAGGGQSAYTLTMNGMTVLMLEAGRYYDPVLETPMFQLHNQAPLRGAPTPDKQRGFYNANVDGGWTIPGEPYTNASEVSDHQFTWWRARMLGGRTNSWGRISLRNGPYDFKAHSRDGIGVDWPISYEDLAPYYDKVEMLIGVYGTNEGLENTPDSPDGVLQPAPPLRAGEYLTQQRARKHLGLPVIPVRRAVLTQRQDSANIPAKLHPGNTTAQKILKASMDSRSACFWATPCYRGCSIKATYQSNTVHLPPALETGKLDILSQAMVRKITLDNQGKASGVVFIDKSSGKEHRARSRTVVLAASSAESIRILLNSKSNRFPDGLANSNGRVGKGLLETVATGLTGQFPLLENLPPHNEDGAGGAHAYIPWWLYREQLAGKLDFPRGYHTEFRSGRQIPSTGSIQQLMTHTTAPYGSKFKEEARRYFGSFIRFSGRGEMIPNDDCFCELDPQVKDQWEIPVIRFHWKWSDYEIRQVAHMQKTYAELIRAMGGKPENPVHTESFTSIDRPGSKIHEVGGATMGTDPGTSVTNKWGQSWEVKNLFVTDGATFVTNSDKNPTLTIMALAWRSCDHLLDQYRKGDL